MPETIIAILLDELKYLGLATGVIYIANLLLAYFFSPIIIFLIGMFYVGIGWGDNDAEPIPRTVQTHLIRSVVDFIVTLVGAMGVGGIGTYYAKHISMWDFLFRHLSKGYYILLYCGTSLFVVLFFLAGLQMVYHFFLGIAMSIKQLLN